MRLDLCTDRAEVVAVMGVLYLEARLVLVEDGEGLTKGGGRDDGLLRELVLHEYGLQRAVHARVGTRTAVVVPSRPAPDESLPERWPCCVYVVLWVCGGGG